ncbi:hypothetical protein SOVF_143190 [Spinacia oleracea]|nr:hypothetical protein SOVF_143190 [Spinacia oleracea]
MEGGPLVLSHCSSSLNCSKLQSTLNHHPSISLWPRQQTSLSCFSSSFSSSSSSAGSNSWQPKIPKPWLKREIKSQPFVSGAGAGPVALKEIDTAPSSLASGKDDDTYTLPRMDKNGRFCSPRAARELALSIVYASCLDGHNPVRLFEKRMNSPRESEYIFDKSSLLRYDHTRFGGPPVITSTVEEADQLLSELEEESAFEAEVLSAPLKLVYSKLLLRFTKKLLGAVVDKWDNHILVIDRVAPTNWKNEPAGRILEFSILHLAMSEISAVGTRHQIVINEAVDLAKRFCDGSAPRVINGCLRTFVQEQS